jgi:hypothetical protein
MKAKKLVLNKKTLVNLDGSAMKAVNGGTGDTFLCPSSPLACRSVLGCPYTEGYGCEPTVLCLTAPYC